MPPRAISPKSCSRAERSGNSGISGEDGSISREGGSPVVASRSTTPGSRPTIAASDASTLVPAEGGGSVSRACCIRQRGQRPSGLNSGRSAPQFAQRFAALIGASPSLGAAGGRRPDPGRIGRHAPDVLYRIGGPTIQGAARFSG